MNMKFMKVVMAIDDCVGIKIPYLLAKKMVSVSKGLKELMELDAISEASRGEAWDEADDEHLTEADYQTWMKL